MKSKIGEKKNLRIVIFIQKNLKLKIKKIRKIVLVTKIKHEEKNGKNCLWTKNKTINQFAGYICVKSI